MNTVEPVLRLIIKGIPATAGSKDVKPIWAGKAGDRHPTGRFNVVESPSPAKQSWRKSVLDEAYAAVRCTCPDPDCTAMRDGFPLDEALVVSFVFTVPKPKSAPKTIVTYPTARPDALKYGRATEDHMTAGGVLKDDARVVEYGRLAKVYPNEDPGALPVPGAIVMVWRRSQLPRIPSLVVPSIIAPDSLFEVNA